MDLLDFMIFRFAYLQMDILFSRIQIVLKEFVIISIDKFQLYIFIYIIFVLALYRITSFNFWSIACDFVIKEIFQILEGIFFQNKEILNRFNPEMIWN